MKRRGKPQKIRLIEKEPKIALFSPRGRPGRPDEAMIQIDELEALRLVDLLGQSQSQAAKSMGISQQTLSRILKRSHRQLADGIVYGKTIKIQGGRYKLNT